MPINVENFNLWYKQFLTELSKNGDAGFVILMTAFPLLERYLRQKSGVFEGDLNQSFYSQLRIVFPVFRNNDEAKEFWHIYRNGLLHQVALSQRNRHGINMHAAWLSNNADTLIIDTNGDFWVNPAKFARKVVETIEGDFSTFEALNSTNHPFPEIDASGYHTSSVQSSTMTLLYPATGPSRPTS